MLIKKYKQDQEGKNLAIILAFVAFHLTLSLSVILAFKHFFDFRQIVVPLHLGMVFVLVITTLVVMGTLTFSRSYREWRYSHHILAIFPSLLTIFLVLLYAIDGLTNKMGAHNVTYNVIFNYIFKPNTLADLLPLSTLGIITVTFVMVGFIFAFYQWISLSFSGAMEAVVLPHRKYSLFRTRRRTIITLALIFAFYGSFGIFMANKFNANHWVAWRGEPIANFLVYWSPFNAEPYRLAIAEEDRILRSNYPVTSDFDKKNIIIVAFDSLRADHMQIYGYDRPTTPFLQSLLKERVLRKVDMALATCPESSCGILSTLSSRNYLYLAEYNLKIYDLLQDQGYKVFIITSDDLIEYQRVRSFLGNIDFYFDSNYSKKFNGMDDRIIFEALEKVPSFNDSPSFFYFHFMSTHLLGYKEKKYNLYKPDAINTDYWAFLRGEVDQESLINRYDNGIIQADNYLRKLFSTLEEKGYLENSLVFIIGDHGEGLGEKGNYGHDYHIYQPDIGIPMLIYDTAEIEYPNLEFASQIDIAPTIFDRIGLPIPQSWQGSSLIDDKVKTYSYHQTRWGPPYTYAVFYRKNNLIFKYMRWPEDKDTGTIREELYELMEDPGEAKNIIASVDQGLLNELRRLMDKGFTPELN